MNCNLQFENSLIESANLADPKNLRVLVEYEVIRKCITRGFISDEDKNNKTNLYHWVMVNIDHDYKALSLFRKCIPHNLDLSNVKVIYDEVEDMSEAIMKNMAKKIINRQIELPF